MSIDKVTLSTANLDSVFKNAITTILNAERQPVTAMETERDTVSIRKGVFQDVKLNLDTLQSAIHALMSTNSGYSMSAGRKATVMAPSGSSVLTATTSSSTALAGDYEISVTNLARAQRSASAVQTSSTLALNKTGVIWLGGTGTASASLPSASDTLTAVGTASLATSVTHELGTGNYTLQTRDVDGSRQFRLVDADGNPVSIAKMGATDGSMTDSWQKLSTTGVYDTGRGLTLTLANTGSAGSTTFSYTAKGVSVNIVSSDSLVSIADKVNSAVQPEGRDVAATLVGNQLVFSGVHTGENHSLIFSETAGLGFSTVQTARNSSFTVNGLSISRSSNDNLTDVISGATLNLASDAEGKTAQLSIDTDVSGPDKAVDAFVSALNTTLSHLAAKMAITSKQDGDETTYTRGPLNGNSTFTSLRYDLAGVVLNNQANSGQFRGLSEIGITIDDNFKVSVNASKLSDALLYHTSDVTALLDAAMGKMDTLVSRFTGDSGYLTHSIDAIDEQVTQINDRIQKRKDQLSDREEALINQYSALQSQLVELGYFQQEFAALYNSSTSIDYSA